jgi:2-polyprenyl-3-methyl-5-hydroxy-6-metoxy-1,4-benzoquinol methylase
VRTRLTGQRALNTRRGFKVAAEQAGIEGVTFHSTRHAFASRMIDRGISSTVLAALMIGRRSQALRLPFVDRILDPEGAHLAALHRLADFEGQAVLELGCGDGRLTVGIAGDAASVFAFDPDAEAVEKARRSLPAELVDRVAYKVASGSEIEIEPASFDLVVFSWSL